MPWFPRSAWVKHDRRLYFLLSLVILVVSRWTHVLSQDKIGDKRVVLRQLFGLRHCLETTFFVSRQLFCLRLCVDRDNLCCLETTLLSPSLSRDNVFAHLETTKKTSYNKKDNLRRYTPRRGNYGKITTQGQPSWCPTLEGQSFMVRPTPEIMVPKPRIILVLQIFLS